jgi:hypothetical protein
VPLARGQRSLTMPKGFKNMKNKAKQKATNYAAKKLYGADVIEAVAQDWWAQAIASDLHCTCDGVAA